MKEGKTHAMFLTAAQAIHDGQPCVVVVGASEEHAKQLLFHCACVFEEIGMKFRKTPWSALMIGESCIYFTGFYSVRDKVQRRSRAFQGAGWFFDHYVFEKHKDANRVFDLLLQRSFVDPATERDWWESSIDG